MGGAARGNGSPLQGFEASPTPPPGDAVGWYGTAPVGLIRYRTSALGWRPGNRTVTAETAEIRGSRFSRPWRDLVCHQRRPSTEVLGYCLSPAELGWESDHWQEAGMRSGKGRKLKNFTAAR